MASPEPGWAWLERVDGASFDDDDGLALARRAARVFSGADGDALLQHLKDITVERCLGPESGAEALRDMEGRRRLVLHLMALIRRGRAGN